jgi:DHA2 family methylenomycin A resistance protein-like MFS transporter
VNQRLIRVIGACAGFFLITLDASVVNVALPSMAAGFRAGLPDLQWVVDGYTVALAGAVVVAGVASDRFGAGRVFHWGTLGFAVTSLLCALAPSVTALVAARVAQGVAGAVMLPSSMSVVTGTWPDAARRTRALGWWAAGGGAAVAAGPVVGGLFTGAYGWRSVFLVNVPVALLGTLVVGGDGGRGHRGQPPSAWDPRGQLLLVVALSCGIGTLIEFQRVGGRAPVVLGGAVLCLSAAVMLADRAGRGSAAVPLDQLRRPGVAVAVTAGALLNVTFFGVVFALGLALQREHQLSPARTGLVLLPASLLILLANLVAGAGIRRWGARSSLALGLLVEGVGFLLTAAGLKAAGGATPLVAAALLPVGVGAGWASPAMMAVLMDAVTPGRDGQMAGFLNGARQAGSAVGVAAAGLTLTAAPTLSGGAALYTAAAGVVLVAGAGAGRARTGRTRGRARRPDRA